MARTTKAYKQFGYSTSDEASIQIHVDALMGRGCLLCAVNGGLLRTPELHHIRQGYGLGQRGPDHYSLALCFRHHRSTVQGDISFHGTPAAFRALYGTERALLAMSLDRQYPDRIFPPTYTPRIMTELTGYMHLEKAA